MKTFIQLLLVCIPFIGFAQSDQPCAAGSVTAPSISVSSTCNYITANTTGLTQQTNANNGGNPPCGSMGEDGWFSFIAPPSGSVQMQTIPGSITDAVAAIYSGTCGSFTLLGCDDDGGAGTMPALLVGSLTPGTQYFLRLWDYGGGTGTLDVCLMEVPAIVSPTNETCANSEPVCSGTPIVFAAQSGGSTANIQDPGNNYSCLSTTPNPTWFYLEIDGGGNLSIDITAASDIDFAIWGPFSSLLNAQASCGSYGNPEDCSYSSAAVEQANIASVLPGEVYILLVTNYANTPQSITLVEAGSNTASTDCSIVPLPVELTSFSGQKSGSVVELAWATASEKDNNYFEVQKRNKLGFFETFAVEKGAGNASNLNRYSAIDESPMQDENYYRLKQVDYDGNTNFSDVIYVSGDWLVPELILFPNPSSGTFKVKTNQTILHLKITGLDGVTKWKKTKIDSKQALINLPEILPGMYILEVETVRGKTQEKITIR